MSIFGVYLLTLPDTNAASLGLVFTIGSLMGFIAEVPSGYLSDKLGHKESMILSRFLYVCSTGCFLVGFNIWWFIVGIILMNVGHAFWSGTNSAFMHETLRALGKDDQYATIMGKMKSTGFVLPIIFIVTVPFLVTISYRAALVLPLVLDVIGLLIAFTLIKPPVTPQMIEEISNTNFKAVIKEGVERHIFSYLFLMGLMLASVMVLGGFKDVYQQLLGIPVVYYGIFWAGSRVFVALLLRTNGFIKARFSFHQFLWAKFLGAMLLILLLAIVKHPAVVVFIFMLSSAFNWSFTEANTHYLLEKMGNSNFKATLLSFEWGFNNLIRSLLVIGFGFISTVYSFQVAFFTLAATLLIAGLLSWVWIYRKQ